MILPVDNKRDWEELDDKTREHTSVHFASVYKDVYEIAFSKAESRAAKSKRLGAEAPAE